jgi:hypothetical protein
MQIYLKTGDRRIMVLFRAHIFQTTIFQNTFLNLGHFDFIAPLLLRKGFKLIKNLGPGSNGTVVTIQWNRVSKQNLQARETLFLTTGIRDPGQNSAGTHHSYEINGCRIFVPLFALVLAKKVLCQLSYVSLILALACLSDRVSCSYPATSDWRLPTSIFNVTGITDMNHHTSPGLKSLQREDREILCHLYLLESMLHPKEK